MLDAEPVYFFHSDHGIKLPEAIVIGDFSVSFYGICLVIAALIGILITVMEAKRKKHEPEEYLSVLCLVFLFGGIGARIFYILFHWEFFRDNFWWTLELRTGGLSFYGALFAAWIAVKKYCGRKKINFYAVSDVLGIAASAASIPVWIGCILQKEPFGTYYNGIFSMQVRTEFLFQHNSHLTTKGMDAATEYLDGVSYTSMHPVAVYGLILGIVLAVSLQILRKYIRTEGSLFVLYLFFTAVQNLVLSFVILEKGNFFGIRIPIIAIVSVVLIGTILVHIGWNQCRKLIQKKNKLF